MVAAAPYIPKRGTKIMLSMRLTAACIDLAIWGNLYFFREEKNRHEMCLKQKNSYQRIKRTIDVFRVSNVIRMKMLIYHFRHQRVFYLLSQGTRIKSHRKGCL